MNRKLTAGAALAFACLMGCASQAPPKYKAKFESSKGNFVIDVDRSWSPLGADRFYAIANRHTCQ